MFTLSISIVGMGELGSSPRVVEQRNCCYPIVKLLCPFLQSLVEQRPRTQNDIFRLKLLSRIGHTTKCGLVGNALGHSNLVLVSSQY